MCLELQKKMHYTVVSVLILLFIYLIIKYMKNRKKTYQCLKIANFYLFAQIKRLEKHVMIIEVYSEAINQRRTDNTMAQVNGQTTIYKTLHRKLKTGDELRWFLSYNTS